MQLGDKLLQMDLLPKLSLHSLGALQGVSRQMRALVTGAPDIALEPCVMATPGLATGVQHPLHPLHAAQGYQALLRTQRTAYRRLSSETVHTSALLTPPGLLSPNMQYHASVEHSRVILQRLLGTSQTWQLPNRSFCAPDEWRWAGNSRALALPWLSPADPAPVGIVLVLTQAATQRCVLALRAHPP